MDFPSGEKYGDPSHPLFASVIFVIAPPSVETKHNAVSVLQASRFRAALRVNATNFPSGEISNKCDELIENTGASKSPGVKSRGAFVEIAVMNKCVRFPCRHS